MEARTWPLFGLRVVTPRLVLRYPDDNDLVALAELAARGIHDPSTMPFSIPWTDQEPPQLQRGALQWHWRQRADWSAENWHLPFATVVDDQVVGTQGVAAEQFPLLRQVATGSWLGQEYQGLGIGKEMRAAVLHFAFAGLGAAYAMSGAWHDNLASQKVSEAFGYEEEGRRRALRRDQPDWLVGLRLSRERWEAQRRDDIVVEGLDDCADMFGLR